MPNQLFIVRKPIVAGTTVIYAAGPGEAPVLVDAGDWRNLDVLVEQGYLMPYTPPPADPSEPPIDPSESLADKTPEGAPGAKGNKAKK